MWRFGARDVEAARRLDLFVVSGVATVLIVRAYLAALDYPQVGGGGLHIAHAIWGALFMALAVMLTITTLGRGDKWLAALVGGVGFGLFIDELGKFITADVDYFFEPTAALIYVCFLVIYLGARFLVDRPEFSAREELENAADMVRASASRAISESERTRIEMLLAEADPRHPLTAALAEVLPRLPVRDDRPSRLRSAVERGRAALTRVVSRPIVRYLVAVVAVLFVASALAQVGSLIVAEGDLRTADASTQDGFVAWAATIGSLIQAVITGLGLWALRRSRLEAYLWFERALLVNLLVTQVFLFAQDQFAATTGFLLSLAALIVLRILIRSEERDAAAGGISRPPLVRSSS